MPISPRAVLAVVTLLAPLAPRPVAAGTFRVTPVRVTLERGARATAVAITNEGGEPVTVQLDVRSWSQGEDGEDLYTPTEEILIFPRMATLAPGAEQIVRLGLRGRGGTVERTFRLFVRELPVRSPGEMVVKLSLNVAIPIFVKPAKPRSIWAIEWASLSEEALAVRVVNSGNTHVRISKVVATGLRDGVEVFSREATGRYALASTAHQFHLAIPREDCGRARRVRVEAIAEAERRPFLIEVAPAMCAPAPPAPPPPPPPAESRSG